MGLGVGNFVGAAVGFAVEHLLSLPQMPLEQSECSAQISPIGHLLGHWPPHLPKHSEVVGFLVGLVVGLAVGLRVGARVGAYLSLVLSSPVLQGLVTVYSDCLTCFYSAAFQRVSTIVS